jgi:hypothetical protein
MATPNAISVALFNAAAGAYAAQVASDTGSLANSVGLILEKDISNDAMFVEHLLNNFGVISSMSIYLDAKNSLTKLVQTQGRGNAVITAIDFLKTQESLPNEYALVALNFSFRVSQATLFSANNPNERDITKLVAAITGVDTDLQPISEAVAAVTAALSINLQSALAAANAKAEADKAVAVELQKTIDAAATKVALEKAAADLKLAQDKVIADAAAAKIALADVVAKNAAELKTVTDSAAQAAIKAIADRNAAVASVDKTTDNAAAITSFLKFTAASMGLTGYESMSDSQVVTLIRNSDNQAIAAAVDKAIDNPAAITDYLITKAKDMGVVDTATMDNSVLIDAMITTYLRKTAKDMGVVDPEKMANAQLLDAIKKLNDADIRTAQQLVDDNLAKIAADKAIADAAALKVITDAAAAKAVADAQALKVMTDAAAAQAVVDKDNAIAAEKAASVAAVAALKLQTDAAAAQAALDLQDALKKIQDLQTINGITRELTIVSDTILAISGGNDIINATNSTYGTDDLIVDTSEKDSDMLVLSTADDISAIPVVVGIENFNVNVTSVYGGNTGPTVLTFNADNLRKTQLNFDVTNVSSVVNALEVTNLPSAIKITSSNKFTNVSISADDKALVNYVGSPTSLSIDSPGTLQQVKAVLTATTASTVSTDSDNEVTLTTAGDTSLIAANASSVVVTSAGQATIVANAALSVTVNAAEEAFVTANAANKLTFFTGDGNDGATSLSVIESTLSSTNINPIEVTVEGQSLGTVLDLTGAANVKKVIVNGTQNVTLKVSLVGIDGLGTATTSDTTDDNLFEVSNANSGITTLWIKSTGGDADFSMANVNSIVVGAAMGPANDLTVKSGAVLVVAVDQTNDLDIISKLPGGSVDIGIKDNATAGVSGDLTVGLKLTDFAKATLTNNDLNAQADIGPVFAPGTALTIASGTQGFVETSSIYLSTGILSINGSGAVDLGNKVTASSLAGSNSVGAITVVLAGLDYVGDVKTGVGNDTLTISGAIRNGGAAYDLETGSGSDTLTLSLVQNLTWKAGADYDTLKIVGSLDLTASSITLNSVDQISLDSSATGAGTLKISSTTFNTNNAFNLRGSSAVTDTLIVQGLVGADTINASAVAVDATFASLKIIGGNGDDTITGSSSADTIDGGLGIDSLSGGSGGDTYIYNSGDVDGGEFINESSFETGVDTVYVLTSTDFSLMTAASFDEIEAITLAAGQTAKFTDDQINGDSIVLTGTLDGVETVEVYVDAGKQFNSMLTDATGNINSIYYFGTTGAESISGGAMSETIKGGAGSDLLSGGGGTDTYVFELAANNGADRLTFGVVNGLAVDDILDFSVNVFLGDGAPNIGLITELSTETVLTSAQANNNILVLQNARFADAAALNLSTMLFADIFNTDGKVLFIYAGTDTTDARIAIATVSDAGSISGAVDVAILVGVTIDEAITGLAAGNFIL